MVCAFIIALINTRFSSFPIGLNFVADFFIAIFTLNVAANVFGYGWPSSSWCSSGRYDDDVGCEGWFIAVQVLVGVGAGLGVIVGLVFPSLLSQAFLID